MIALIFFAGLYLTNIVIGDYSTTDDSSSVSTSTTTTASPSWSMLSPKSSPTYGLDDTVPFVWNQKDCLMAGYFCHSYRDGLGWDRTTSWIQPEWCKSEDQAKSFKYVQNAGKNGV